jgi:hypothetical protein
MDMDLQVGLFPLRRMLCRGIAFRLSPLAAFLVLLLAALSGAMRSAWAAGSATTTTLTITSGGRAATSVPHGGAVTLTATVAAGNKPVLPGQIRFCESSAASCEDIHLLATVQLTGAGKAVFKFHPGIGSHRYKAIFLGTTAHSESSSPAVPLTVTHVGSYATTTRIARSEAVGNYTLTARVSAEGPIAPTGEVSFLDKSKGDAELATAKLGEPSHEPEWAEAASPVTGLNPFAIATADFNRDGIPDLAVANYGSDTVTILLGKGDGTFTAVAESPLSGADPTSIASGDFNDDGNPDLAIVSDDTGDYMGPYTVTVLLGNGDGTFTAAPSPETGNQPSSIAIGDFNRDGIADLAVTNTQDDTVTILIGKGDGTFRPMPNSPATGTNPEGIVAGDFNGDNILDLAVANGGADTVTVLLGKGDGTFREAESPATGSQPYAIVAGDFNGDGNLDLAVANEASDNVTILLGKGNGSFRANGKSPATGKTPIGIAVGDLNGDGIADLAIPNDTSNTLSVLLGNGDGTFKAAPASPSTDELPFGIVAADFTGDGDWDLAVADYGVSNLTVLLAEPATASATATGISVGVGSNTHEVEASYAGDNNHDASISGAVGLTPELLSALTSPAPGSTLTGSSVTFSWTAGRGVTAYRLSLGTAGPGSRNLYDSRETTATSVQVTGLPEVGAKVMVRLDSKIDGAWLFADYTYTEAGKCGQFALCGSQKLPSAFESNR